MHSLGELKDSEGKPLEEGFYVMDILIEGSVSPLVYVRYEQNKPTGIHVDGSRRFIGNAGEADCQIRADWLKSINPHTYLVSMAKRYRAFIDSRGEVIFEDSSKGDFKDR